MIQHKKIRSFAPFLTGILVMMVMSGLAAQEPGQPSRPRLINGVAVPSDFPELRPTIIRETAPGYIFMNNWGGNPYILIFENDGTPRFYRRVDGRSRDFKVQPNGVLSRRVTARNWGFETMDKNYKTIRAWNVQGYDTDEHGMQLTEEGTALMIGLDRKQVNMAGRVTGGHPDATVVANLIQEVDENNKVVFEWKGWDYFNIEDAVHEDLTAKYIDFMHTNSVAVDYDGHLVISSRHQNECTKINRETGQVIWRLGGKRSDFQFTDGDYISYQHDCRPVPGKPDHYTVFDNGNFKQPEYTRVVEFRLDVDNGIAHTVWEYRHEPDRYTWWMGNAQRLPNGNTFINWADGSLPKATEVTPDGEVVYEADFREYIHCYRAFRFEWDGMLLQPELIVEEGVDMISLIYNKFGDTAVVSYNVYGDTLPQPEQLIANTGVNYLNLDTSRLVEGKQYYFMVRAVYQDGSESEASNIATALSDFIKPGENMIVNSDFAMGLEPWIFEVADQADARFEQPGAGDFLFIISDGGEEYFHVQLRQNGIPLIQGKKYLFEFNAIADHPRLIEAKVGQDHGPWTNYSRVGLSYVTSEWKTFQYEFTMQEPSDFNARIVFNCGTDRTNIRISNISLSEVVPQVVGVGPGAPDAADQHMLIYPNPAEGILNLSLYQGTPGSGIVSVYDLNGRLIRHLLSKQLPGGSYDGRFDVSSLKPGMYVIRFQTRRGVSSGRLLITE